jgi:hypothetical protein
MSSRKPGSSPVLPTPTSVRSIKPTTSTISAEYIEAIHVLNEGTLNQACDLLLDDTHLEEEKILELYCKCEDALKVIQKQQPIVPSSPMMLPPGAPNLNAPRIIAAAQRSLPKLNKKSLSLVASSSKGVIPMRRTSLLKNPSNRLVRERSEGDAPFHENKKARVSPPAPDGVMAPPPSALNFLAKLNKDPKVEPSKPEPPKPEPLKPDLPKRKNPARNLHRRSSA